jgi:preprotein translocase subunit SecY
MELGIGPIVTAGLIMQILAGSKILNVDMTNAKDRGLFTGTQKLLAIVMTLFEGAAFILGGNYGSPNLITSVLILVQLLAVGWAAGSASSSLQVWRSRSYGTRSRPLVRLIPSTEQSEQWLR